MKFNILSKIKSWFNKTKQKEVAKTTAISTRHYDASDLKPKTERLNTKLRWQNNRKYTPGRVNQYVTVSGKTKLIQHSI